MEALIRIVDKGVALDVSKAGDVIAVQDDGWGWSPAELTNPDWRIVRVPILAVEVETLLSRVYDPDGLIQGPVRRREYTINFSKLPNPALFSGARTQAIIDLTRQQVLKAVVKKP